MLYVPPVGDGKFLWSNFRLNIVPPQTRPAILNNDENFHFSAFLSPFDDCNFNFKREIKDTWECSQSRKHRCERRNLNCELMIKRRRRRVNAKKIRLQSERNLTCGVLDAKKLWLRIAQQAMEKSSLLLLLRRRKTKKEKMEGKKLISIRWRRKNEETASWWWWWKKAELITIIYDRVWRYFLLCVLWYRKNE